VEEVQNHLGPIAATVSRLDKTVRSLYSNGSGGPPGFLETARKEDDERYDRLFTAVKVLTEDQKEANRFIVLASAEQDRKAKFRKMLMTIGWKVGAVIASAMIGLATWAYHEVAPVAKVLWEEYVKAHPSVTERLKIVGNNDDPAYAEKHKPPEVSGSGNPHF